jgi:hypothetical protein
MSRLVQTPILLAGLAFVGSGAAYAQERSDEKSEISILRAAIGQLRSEVAVLHSRITRLELEKRQDSIRQTKTEIEKLRVEHAQLAEMDAARQQDLREIEQQLAREDLQPSERLELEAARTDLAVARGRDLTHQSEAVLARESELLRRLDTEELIAKQLERTLKSQGGKTQ